MFLTNVLLAALLAISDAVPAKVQYEFIGKHKGLLLEPDLETIDGPRAVTFTIHAKIDHHPHSGTRVSVWITPGIPEQSKVQKACVPARNAICGRDTPDQDVARILFTEALNDALAMNEEGFGQYAITRCDDPPVTKDYGWLHLAPKVAVAVDVRHIYTVANVREGKTASLTQFVLGFGGGSYSYAKFGPLETNKLIGAAGLDHLWSRCASEAELKLLGIVTQLRAPVLTENKQSPLAGKS